jgi:hypothetical protein
MMLLNYLSDVSYECSPGDANVAAFTEAVSIIGDRNATEEFLACGMWPLQSCLCDFEVETKEAPLSKVIVPMPKGTPVIGQRNQGQPLKRGSYLPLICWLAIITSRNIMPTLGFVMAGLIIYFSWQVCSANYVRSPLPVLLGNKRLLLRFRLRR